jgi:transposase
VAVGHSLLVMVYHVLARQMSYNELGGDYFDKQNLESQRQRLIRRLEATGLKVMVEEVQNAA